MALSVLFGVLRLLLKLVGIIVGAIVLYFLCALILTLIPSNSSWTPPAEGITIYVKSNGVHTDLVLPYQNDLYDWSQTIHTQYFPDTSSSPLYVAFGWGDKGFYLETPTWADLKFSTAFKAMFLAAPTAMHVNLYKNPLEEGEKVKKILLSKEQYLKLVDFVTQAFEKNAQGQYIPIHGHHYVNQNDCFYEAQGSYSLFRTCNVWTNQGLKIAGVKTAVWAPFEPCIMYHR